MVELHNIQQGTNIPFHVFLLIKIDTSMKKDVICVSDRVDCKFREYEVARLKHLSNNLTAAGDHGENELKSSAPEPCRAHASEILDQLNRIQEMIEELESLLKAGKPG